MGDVGGETNHSRPNFTSKSEFAMKQVVLQLIASARVRCCAGHGDGLVGAGACNCRGPAAAFLPWTRSSKCPDARAGSGKGPLVCPLGCQVFQGVVVVLELLARRSATEGKSAGVNAHQAECWTPKKQPRTCDSGRHEMGEMVGNALLDYGPVVRRDGGEWESEGSRGGEWLSVSTR